MALLRPRRLLLLGLGVVVPCLVLAGGKYPLDLAVYRDGGTAVLHADPLYALRIGRYGFTYPPFAALVFSPMAAVSLPIVTVVATAGSLIALALVMHWSCRDLLHKPGPTAALLIVALAASSPVRETLWNGQINLVLMALVLADVLNVTSPRWRGALVGLAAAIKLTPALFIVYLALRGRTRDALRASGAFLAATAVAALVLPQDSFRFWTKEVFTGSGIGDLARVSDQSLHGLVLRGSDSTLAWLIVVVPTVLAGLYLAVAAGRAGREGLAAGVVGVLGCLISPVSWVHHWVLVLPCLGGLAGTVRSSHERRMIAVASAIFVVGPVEAPSDLSRALPPFSPALSWILANTFILTAVMVGFTALIRLTPVRSRFRQTFPAVRWIRPGSASRWSSRRQVKGYRQRHAGGKLPIHVVVGIGHVEAFVPSAVISRTEPNRASPAVPS